MIKKLIKAKSYIGDKLGQGRDPSINSLILGNRKNISLLDTRKTLNQLTVALYVLSKILKAKGHLLIINTNPDFSFFIDNIIKNAENISYCNSKWVGGTLTNWNQVSKSLITFARFSEKFSAFLTTNNIYFPRYKKMKKSFQGFIRKKERKVSITMTKKPDILFILNPNENRNVIQEAIRLNIPVIALIDCNTNIAGITYPIVANNKSIESIHLFFSWITRLLKKI